MAWLCDDSEVKFDIKDEEANEYWKKSLLSDKPWMCARLGSETLLVIAYKEVHLRKSEWFKRYIKRELYFGEWENMWYDTICKNAGIFPADAPMIERFCQIALDSMKVSDVWQPFFNMNYEIVEDLDANVVYTQPQTTNLFFRKHPWTSALKGKKVLVISPFEKSIKQQYAKRELLFENPEILPEFELHTLKAVQSIAGTKTEYNNWEDALESMKMAMRRVDFDICLVGAGAYSLPLCAEAKKMGKKSIYVGGMLQLIFGIKGNRWDNNPDICGLYNQYWIRPIDEDNVINKESVEGGCYW